MKMTCTKHSPPVDLGAASHLAAVTYAMPLSAHACCHLASWILPPRLPRTNVRLDQDFISEEEETRLVTFLDSDEGTGYRWQRSTLSGPKMAKSWGMSPDIIGHKLNPAVRPMPDIFRPLARRMRTIRLPCRRGARDLNPHSPSDWLSCRIRSSEW